MQEDLAYRRNQPNDTVQSHVAWLETLSIDFLESVNRREMDPLLGLDYLCPYFQTFFQFSRTPTRENRVENNAHLRSVLVANPNYTVEVVNICTDLDLSQRKARVWVTIRVCGISDNGLTRERISIVDWVKQRQGWACIKHTAALGPGGFTLPD